MSRTVERLIDLVATAVLLLFAWFLRTEQPGLAGAVCMASIAFWLQKNAASAESPAHLEAAAVASTVAATALATATAAAEVLATARRVVPLPVAGDPVLPQSRDE